MVETGVRTRFLVPLLITMTVVTGLVDAVSYLSLGRVFVANMTGNVVFLGFAWAGEASLSAAASIAAVLAFLVGAAIGGAMINRSPSHRGWQLVAGLCVTLTLLLIALIVSVIADRPFDGAGRYALISLLAIGMGVQNATVRALGVPDATTTVLTLTLTGLAADSQRRVGANPRVPRRVLSVAAMLGGAFVGTLLVRHAAPGWALAGAVAITALVVATAAALSRRTAADLWT
jgi:uncharacterized membrane protein YoaK (UPF0700 family)